jgi:hypothetical protein
MLSSTRLAPATVVPGLLAGIVGAAAIDAYLLLTFVAATHTETLDGFFGFIASGAIGKSAYGEPSSIWLGLAIHVAVSLAWGVGYAYAAARAPQLNARPITSGIVFGVVVMIAMQLVEVAANIYTLPNTFSLLNQFVAHTLFFGIPIAWIVAARARAAS